MSTLHLLVVLLWGTGLSSAGGSCNNPAEFFHDFAHAFEDLQRVVEELMCNQEDIRDSLDNLQDAVNNLTQSQQNTDSILQDLLERVEDLENCTSRPGGWSEWNEWGTCSSSCGDGVQTRVRFCNDPSPGGCGPDCSGSGIDFRMCNAGNCTTPTDGNWGGWTPWSECSVTCGGGEQTRQRCCDSPAPQNGGANCAGDSTQSRSCNTQTCAVNGNWGGWTAWNSCNVTCGGGVQSRSRDCSNPAPQNGGANCFGDDFETQECNTNGCPVDGGWTQWSSWFTCNATCGGGTRVRIRTCSHPIPANGGSTCSGLGEETESCNNNPCPINGNWGGWGSWGGCPVACGGGIETRNRTCDTPPAQFGGVECPGSDTETRECNSQACPVDGGFTDWCPWAGCSVTCGGGTQSRSRTCTNPAPQFGGANCTGDTTETQACNTDPCPVNGNWGGWGSWGGCPVACGGGIETRNRTCDTPPAQFGGVECPGSDTETRECNSQACPVDGGFTEWCAWEGCSVTCGGGNQSRSRSCTNPAPQFGGANCTGDTTETQACNTDPCPVNGNWGGWGSWDGCPVACGGGIETRNRTCDNPPAQFGGVECPGSDTETRECNSQACPIDGGFTDWCAWAGCSVTCGGGTQSRSRTCTNPAPQFGGANCTGDTTETQACNTDPCPVNGNWGGWGSWDGCPVTCGGGIETRNRTCDNPPAQFGGVECPGSDTETRECNSQACPIDGGFTEWCAWEGCSATCGGGTQSRSRTCTNPAPQFGGANCTGDTTETQACNTDPCPVNGNWGGWGSWDGCTVACGGGIETRNRTCDNPPAQFGGAECPGSDTETQECNSQACPIDGGFSDWCPWEGCSVTCGGGTQSRSRTCTNPPPQFGGANCTGNFTETQECNTDPCPVPGGLAPWSVWTECPVTCGGGTQSRNRTCTDPVPQFGGAECIGETTETQQCNTDPCPIDGGFTPWTSWTTCPVTCGGGSQSRTRSCNNPPPLFGGANCTGDTTETQDCNTDPCPIDGGFTPWSNWTECPVTCGGGVQSRNRTCTNPAPQNGGADCVGDTTETQSCNTDPCPIDGGFSPWSAWTPCPVTCGGGTQLRVRTCSNPVPQYGGANCSGDTLQTQSCNTNECPIDGEWTDWSPWSTCNVTCGGGTQSRTRTCSDPAPQYGGANCTGNATETQECNTQNCPIDGNWSQWGPWGACDVTCGGGTQTRSRNCTDPAPEFGGDDCAGADTGGDTETQSCNEQLCPCPAPYSHELGSSCYFVGNDSLTYAEAQAACAAESGGTLVEIESSPENSFLQSLTLTNPSETCSTVADVVFVLDESGSVGASNFELSKQFVKDIISSFAIGANATQVGVMTFDGSQVVHFHLDANNDLASAFAAIDAIPYNGGTTNIGAAINFARTDMFITANGDRPDVDNIMVVITDGVSNIDSARTAAEAAYAEGIKIVAVGIGSGIDIDLLNAIATDPDTDNVILAADFTALNDTVEAVQNTICTFSGYWIGATDQTVEGIYMYPSSGSALTYADWASGQPANEDGTEDCVVIDINEPANGQWAALSCGTRNRYICELVR